MPRRGSRLGGCGAAMSPAFIDQGTKKKTHFRKVRFLNGAGDRVRTDNLDLGKVALCQLSYTRKKNYSMDNGKSVRHVKFENRFFSGTFGRAYKVGTIYL